MRSVFIIAIAGLALSGCNQKGHVLTESERLAVEIGARRFADGANARYVGCFTTDIDGNGYITCTNRLLVSDELFELACGYGDSKIGCKRKPKDEHPQRSPAT